MPHSTEFSTEAQTQGDFPGIPPFPSDVPTAPLLHINLQKLLAGDESEIKRLGDASSEIGFFLLDLRGAKTEGETPEDVNSREHVPGAAQVNGSITPAFDGDLLLKEADELFALNERFFSLPVEEKEKYNFKSKKIFVGYKGIGAGYTDKTGKRDRNEMWDMAKDDIVGNSEQLPAPDLVNETDSRRLYKSYVHNAHALQLVLLNSLERYLGLPSNTLAPKHKLQGLSDDKVRVMRAPPQDLKNLDTSLGAHADSGSITILMNKAGGLQVYPPEGMKGINTDKQEWLYVKPAPGHAIVNIGNALVALTAGIMRSNFHRVMPPPGEQVSVVRTSLMYFGRPERDVLLEPLDESEMIAKAKETAGNGEGLKMGDKYMGMVQKRRV